MKKLLQNSLLMAIALFFCNLTPNNVTAQTAGTLTFTVNLTSHNGNYGLDHYVAVWIENSSNTFVKTKLRRSDSHGTNSHLPVWKASSNSNVTDATTGASLTSYTPQTITWNATNVSGTVVPDGTYNVRVEFTWQHGTTATSNTTISFTKGPASVHLTPANQTEYTNMVLDWVPAAAAPVANFTSSATSICENGNITFTDQSTNTPTSWAWNFGDGQSSTSQNPSHTYATPGNYTVSLTATNGSGSDVTTANIVVNPTLVPTVSFTVTPNVGSVCPGTTVTLTATPTNGGTPTYSWTVDGNAVGGTGNNYSAVFNDGQNVVCTMTSNALCVSPTTATANYTTSVYTVVPVTITDNSGTYTSDATSGNQWYEQASGILTGETGQTYTPTTNGTYYTIVTDGNGCTTTSNSISYTSSIETNLLNDVITIYPNPSNGIVNISFNETASGQLSIEDITGKKVYQESFEQKSGSVKTIDLSKYTQGIYFIKFNDQKYRIFIEK